MFIVFIYIYLSLSLFVAATSKDFQQIAHTSCSHTCRWSSTAVGSLNYSWLQLLRSSPSSVWEEKVLGEILVQFCWCIVLRETVCLSTFSLPSTTFKACFVEWVVDNLQFDFEILRKNHETSMRHDLHWLTSWSLSMISEVSSLDFIDFFVSENSHKVMQGMGFLRKRHDMVDWCGEGWYHLNICISPKSSYSEDFSPAVLKHHAEWGGGLI